MCANDILRAREMPVSDGSVAATWVVRLQRREDAMSLLFMSEVGYIRLGYVRLC